MAMAAFGDIISADRVHSNRWCPIIPSQGTGADKAGAVQLPAEQGDSTCPHTGQLRSAGGQTNQKTAHREGEKSDWKRGGERKGTGQEQIYWAVKRSMKTKGAAALCSDWPPGARCEPSLAMAGDTGARWGSSFLYPESPLQLWPGLISDRYTMLQPLGGKHKELLKKIINKGEKYTGKHLHWL